MRRNKIDFMIKLFERLKCRVEILDFLKEEKVIDDAKKQYLLLSNPNTHADLFVNLLDDLQKRDLIQLLNYEWIILPNEFMKLTIVTASAHKDFIWSV